VEALLGSKVLPFDQYFLARFGFVRLHFVNLRTLRSIAHGIAFHPLCIRSLDGFHVVECKAGSLYDGALVAGRWFFSAGFPD